MALKLDSASSVVVETSAIDITDLVFNDNIPEAIIAYELGTVDAENVFTGHQSLTLRLAGQDLTDTMVAINGVIGTQADPDFYTAVQTIALAAIRTHHGMSGGVLI